MRRKAWATGCRMAACTTIGAGLLIWVAGCGRREAAVPGARAGLDRLRDGRAREAIALLERADEEAPGNATVLCNLGVAYARLNHNERAVDYLKQAAVAASDDPRPLEFLGHVHLKQRNWPLAREAFDEAHRRLPVSPRLITARALVEFEAGEFRQALTFLKRALDLDPDYPPALYNLGLLYRGNPETRDEAEDAFRRFLTAVGDTEPGEDSPELLRRQKTAQTFLQSALDQRPSDPATLASDPDDVESEPDDSEPATSGSEADFVGSDRPKPKPRPVPPVESPAVGLIRRADAAIAKEWFDEALVLLNQAVERHPDHADALWALVVLYDRHLEYREEARTAYALFRERFPADPRQVSVKPKLRPVPPPPAPPQPQPQRPTAQRKPPSRPATPARPEPAFDRKPDPRTALEIWAQGRKRHDQQDWDGAIAFYRKALEYDADLFSAWYNLGLAYRAKGDAVNARRAFQRAVNLKSGTAKAHYMLAVACYDLKLADEAIRHLNQALVREPGYAQAHYLLGLIHGENRRLAAARRHFHRYLQLEPDSAAAERVRIWMERNVEPR